MVISVAKKTRDTMPDCLGLSTRDARYFNRVAELYYKVYGDYHFNGSNKSNELYKEAKKSRISIKNAITAAQAILDKQWFTVYSVVKLSQDNTSSPLAYLVTSSNLEGIIDIDKYPAFYNIWDKCKNKPYSYINQIQYSLQLSEYLYLAPIELELLQWVLTLSASEEIQIPPKGFAVIKSNSTTTAIAAIGRRALAESTFIETAEKYDIPNLSKTKILIGGKQTPTHKEIASLDSLQRQIISKLISEGFNNRTITITLDEFMSFRKLRDVKHARNLLIETAQMYASTTYWIEERKKRDSSYYSINPLSTSDIKGWGCARLSLTPEWFDYIKRISSYEMIPLDVFRLSSSNAYSIAIGIYDHIRRNLAHENERRIKISTLLGHTDLPAHTSVLPKYYKQRIITPFQKALEQAVNAGGLEYIIENKDYNVVDVWNKYDVFISSVLVITQFDEPENGYYQRIRDQRSFKLKIKGGSCDQLGG